MKNLIAALVVVGVWGAWAGALELGLEMDGDVRVGREGVRLGMTIHHEGWRSTSSGVSRDFRAPDAKTSTAVFNFYEHNELCAKGKSTLLARGQGAELTAEITSVREQRPESVVLALELPMDAIAGGKWKTNTGKSGEFAPEWDGKTVHVFSDQLTRFTLEGVKGGAFSLVFPTSTKVMLQDNRRWAKSFTLRISDAQERGRDFNAGAQRAFACRVESAEGTKVEIDHGVDILPGEDWIALDYRKDIEAGSALDFSNQGFLDAPAGKYGWLKNDHGHFVFERLPGKKQRFYGINLCFTACFPDHALADQLVTRLVRLGYNTVRIHHYERGAMEGAADGLALNAENMDRLDYLLAKCREKGIYYTTDLFTSRPVAWRAIGIDRDGMVEQQVYKNMVLVHEPAFENWKAFTRNLLNHVNPYTGIAYKDDAAMPLISLINEGTLSWCWDKIKDESAMKSKWEAWKASTGKDSRTEFTAALERDFVKCATAFMKNELHAKALLTNQNCSGGDKPMMEVRRELYEYVDSHFYVDHPHFLVKNWQLPSKCGNGNPVQARTLTPVAVARVRQPHLPFTITEWNFSGPGMFRGVGGIMTGAVAALQDWDGLWRFAYSHNRENLKDGIGAPGYFDVGTDPLGQAGDRASIMLFLRGDLSAEGMGADPAKSRALRIDRDRGSFALDTAKTAGGFVPSGRLASGAVSFDCGEVATTLWASSLDGEPLTASKRILVTHLTDVQGKGCRYADSEKKILLKWGNMPPLVRNGEAKVSIAVAHPEAFTVWALATTGRRLEQVPAKVVDGKLVFTAAVKGKNGARMLYELAR